MKLSRHLIAIPCLGFAFLIASCGGGGESTGGGERQIAAVCMDASISYNQNCSETCSNHGGVYEWFNHCAVDANTHYDQRFNGKWSGTITRGTVASAVSWNADLHISSDGTQASN